MRLITLKQSIEMGNLKIGDAVDYRPKYGECTLTSDETGDRRDQTFVTENLKYHYVGMSEGKVLLASTTQTRQVIELEGKKGADNGITALNKFCKELYSCSKIGAVGIPLTKELMEKFPISMVFNAYLLASPYVHGDERGVYGVWSDKIIQEKLYEYNDTHKIELTYKIKGSILPAVLLPADILCDEENWIVTDDLFGKMPKNSTDHRVINAAKKHNMEKVNKIIDSIEKRMEIANKDMKDMQKEYEKLKELIEEL